MGDIYEQHKAAFGAVAAFLVMDCKGAPVAKVAFKYPRQGEGRLYAYVHVMGSRMARGFAAGYGYDKHTPAVGHALDKIDENAELVSLAERDNIIALRKAVAEAGGYYWHQAVEKAGYRVLQVL